MFVVSIKLGRMLCSQCGIGQILEDDYGAEVTMVRNGFLFSFSLQVNNDSTLTIGNAFE